MGIGLSPEKLIYEKSNVLDYGGAGIVDLSHVNKTSTSFNTFIVLYFIV
jgi:hypothetical protein